jgi:hypothetical protein
LEKNFKYVQFQTLECSSLHQNLSIWATLIVQETKYFLFKLIVI